MALEQITFNLGALDDAANSGKNYVENQVFEVFNIDDTYADIFADSAGTIPIDQSGIQNISNSDGECKFFIDKGFYNIKSGGKARQLNANFSFEFDTVSDAVNSRFISLLEGRRVFIVERGAYFKVVLTSTITTNDYYKLQSLSIPAYSIAIDEKSFYNLEELGATPDYDPDTQTGTDNSPLIDLIRVDKLNISLNPNKKYKITDSIKIYSGMIWKGDEAYSTEFYPDFSTSGVRMITTPDSTHKDVSLTGFTLVRIGNNAEHGGLLDALDGAKIDLKVLSDGNALGGGIGISPFYPENRPSKNVEVKVTATNGGNFALQIGNVIGGCGELVNEGTQREAFGIEPYTLGKVDISSISASTINYSSHGMITGDPVIYSAQGNTVISGLKNGETYFAIVIDDDNIQLASSTELAWASQNLTLTFTSGTHRFYKAGLCENFLVKSIRSKVGDVSLAGSTTGVIIITATSGGYHRNVRVNGVASELNNPTSGTHNMSVFGAKGVTISDCDILGAELDGIVVTRGFLQGVKDSTGDIDPSPALTLLPDCRVIDNRIKGFKRAGINVFYGRCVSISNKIESEITGATGIIQTLEAESSGSISKYNDANVPNGTSYNLLRGIDNLDQNNELTGSVPIPKIASFKRKISRNLASTSNVVATLSNALEGSGTFSGTLNITAKALDVENTETATYLLHVVKQASASNGALAVVSQLGLVAGGGSTHPSFTWSIDSSNNLIATEIASTDPNRTWYFYVESQGDLKF